MSENNGKLNIEKFRASSREEKIALLSKYNSDALQFGFNVIMRDGIETCKEDEHAYTDWVSVDYYIPTVDIVTCMELGDMHPILSKMRICEKCALIDQRNLTKEEEEEERRIKR